MTSSILRLILVVVAAGCASGGEYCPNTMFYCSNYCCGAYQCCSSCLNSVYYQPNCYRYTYSVGGIVGGIVSSIIFIIVVSLIISICCGCICSARTGIQRRGRVLRAEPGTITVISQTSTAGYPQAQTAYPQPAQGYPQAAQYKYPQAVSQGYPVGVSQGYPPPYPANQSYGVPPAYNAAYVPDGK